MPCFIDNGPILGVAVETLEHVDMNASRNQVILGSSVMIGLMMPVYVKAHPTAIQTGNETLNELLVALLSSAMLLGAALAFVLDNILPGRYYYMTCEEVIPTPDITYFCHPTPDIDLVKLA